MFRLMNHLQLGCVGLLAGSLIWGLSPIALAKPAPASQAPANLEEDLELLMPDEALPPSGTQIQPVNGTVTVKLINKINAPINFQAVGDTEFRTLGGTTSVTLQKLKVPVTLSVYRPDRGLLNIVPKVVGSKTKTLEITLDATTDFSVDKTIIRIEDNGLVFIY